MNRTIGKFVLTVILVIASSISNAQNIVLGFEGTNNTTFEGDGTMVFNGTATVWEEVHLPAIIGKVGMKSPNWSIFRGDIYTYQFDYGDELFFQVQMPHSWKQGSVIKPHIHISPVDPTIGLSIWHLEYCWANVDQSFPSSSVMLDGSKSITTPKDYQNLVLQFGDIQPVIGSGTSNSDKINSILICRVFRDSSDSQFESLLAFLSFDITYEKNTCGSRNEDIK